MKTVQKILTGLFVCLYMAAPAQTAKDTKVKMIDRILGTWQIDKIYDGKKEIATEAHTQGFQFNIEGHYKSMVGSELLDSGSYRINESNSLLYLENKRNAVPGNAQAQVTWKISFANNTMSLQGYGPQAKRYKYVFVKTKEGSGSAPN
jgi:hypothetical protein